MISSLWIENIEDNDEAYNRLESNNIEKIYKIEINKCENRDEGKNEKNNWNMEEIISFENFDDNKEGEVVEIKDDKSIEIIEEVKHDIGIDSNSIEVEMKERLISFIEKIRNVTRELSTLNSCQKVKLEGMLIKYQYIFSDMPDCKIHINIR